MFYELANNAAFGEIENKDIDWVVQFLNAFLGNSNFRKKIKKLHPDFESTK